MVTRIYYEKIADSTNKLSDFLRSHPEPTPSVRGYIYPSGRVSIGVLPRSTEEDDSLGDAESTSLIPQLYKCHWDYQEGLVREVVRPSPALSSLGLSSVPNHHEPTSRGRYGLNGISCNGRKVVTECAYLLHRKYGRRLGFYTLTCPYTDVNLVYEYNRNIAEINRRYFQYLRRLTHAKGYNFSYVSVYEYQEKRYNREGVPALHIHYISPCYIPGTKQFIHTSTELRYIWMVICGQVVGIEPDTSAAIDSTVVYSSCVSYIGKYMSKGGKITSAVAANAPSQVPSQWWSVSSNLRNALKRYTLQLPDEVSEYLYYNPDTHPGDTLHLYRRKSITIPSGTNPYTGEPLEKQVGVTGYLSSADAFSLQPWKSHV